MGERNKKRKTGLLAEYNSLYTKYKSRDLFLGNDESSQIWFLCKADSLVFLRQENKMESSRATAANPPLEGIQLIW